MSRKIVQHALLMGTVLVSFWVTAAAQDFVTRGKIEYEIRRNNKRIYANQQNNDFVNTLPPYDVSYRELIFSWNHSIYLPGKISEGSNYRSENEVYIDLDKRQSVLKSRQLDEYYVFGDSLRPVRWKIENETRKIAGWECRKAVGKIYDSVYVVAFYCPEIIPQGGPELFTGLPGMILGLAIPRYYTTWFATKLEIANIDEDRIVPPTVKKSKQYDKKELAEILLKKYQDVGWWKDRTLAQVMQSLGGYLIW